MLPAQAWDVELACGHIRERKKKTTERTRNAWKELPESLFVAACSIQVPASGDAPVPAVCSCSFAAHVLCLGQDLMCACRLKRALESTPRKESVTELQVLSKKRRPAHGVCQHVDPTVVVLTST